MNDEEELDFDGDQELDWSFSIRSKDIAALESLAEELDGEFDVQIQEQVEVIDMEGNRSFGEPFLSIIHRAILSPEEVKELEARIQGLAESRGLIYEGVECYDPVGSEEVFGWIAPEDAGWRLRHLTDNGLEEGAEMPWAFLVLAPDLERVQRIAEHVGKKGLDDIDLFDEPDDDGLYAICIFAPGRNDEAELESYCDTIHEIAEQYGGELLGVQFLTREQMHEMFGVEEADSEPSE
jgi:hypothetical protein